jgi:hypothetical protein
LDDISFDDPPLESAPAATAPQAALEDFTFDESPFEVPAAAAAPVTPPPGRAGETPPGSLPGVPDPVVSSPTSAGIAYITVADASGRVLFRRAATAEEVDEALRASEEAEREGQAAMDRIAAERFLDEALEEKKTG